MYGKRKYRKFQKYVVCANEWDKFVTFVLNILHQHIIEAWNLLPVTYLLQVPYAMM